MNRPRKHAEEKVDGVSLSEIDGNWVTSRKLQQICGQGGQPLALTDGAIAASIPANWQPLGAKSMKTPCWR